MPKSNTFPHLGGDLNCDKTIIKELKAAGLTPKHLTRLEGAEAGGVPYSVIAELPEDGPLACWPTFTFIRRTTYWEVMGFFSTHFIRSLAAREDLEKALLPGGVPNGPELPLVAHWEPIRTYLEQTCPDMLTLGTIPQEDGTERPFYFLDEAHASLSPVDFAWFLYNLMDMATASSNTQKAAAASHALTHIGVESYQVESPEALKFLADFLIDDLAEALS